MSHQRTMARIDDRLKKSPDCCRSLAPHLQRQKDSLHLQSSQRHIPSPPPFAIASHFQATANLSRMTRLVRAICSYVDSQNTAIKEQYLLAVLSEAESAQSKTYLLSQP